MERIDKIILLTALIILCIGILAINFYVGNIDNKLNAIKIQTEEFSQQENQIMQEFYNSERKEVVWTNSL